MDKADKWPATVSGISLTYHESCEWTDITRYVQTMIVILL